MLGRTLGREAQHSHTGISKACYRLSGLSGAHSNLRELGSIRHRGNGNVANNENAILTILFLLRDKKHTTTDTGDARSTLDNLEGRTQGVASGREGTGNLSVSTFGLDNHTTQIERVLHQFASFLNGHPL